MGVPESVLEGLKDRFVEPARPASEEKVIKQYECMFVFWRKLDTQGLFVHAYDPMQAAKIFLFNRLLVADMADGPELRDEAAISVRESGSSDWLNFDVTVHLDQLFTVKPAE